MLGEKCYIYPSKYYYKVDLRPGVVEGVARKEGESVYKPGYNGKDSPYRQHIVEVGYDIVGVVKYNIKR